MAAAAQENPPDFSHAGYHAGRDPLPAPEKTRTATKLPFAVAEGDVIEIPAGRYELRDVLEITKSRVVIRGAGSDKTVLVCPRSLTDIRGPNRGWSWSGGLIWVHPPKGKTTLVGYANVERQPAGTRRLKVAWRHFPDHGSWRLLEWRNDKTDTLLDHLYGGVIARVAMGKELRDSKGARVREWVRFENTGGELVLDQPLWLDVRPEWNPRLHHRPYVREVGIEGLRIEFPKTVYPGHLNEKGYNAIQFSSAIDCWVKDVVIVNADSGILLGSCKRVTVTDVRIEGRMMHHCLSASWSSDCLFTRWRIEAPHVHGTTLSWAAHGNVFSQGYGRALAMDCHRAASFRNLHTAIVIDHGKRVWNVFRSGGSKPRGPHSARENVYWNIEHRFTGREEPALIAGHGEWPLGIFLGWHANVPLKFEPFPGVKQQVLQLNEKPEITDLHAEQVSRRR